MKRIEQVIISMEVAEMVGKAHNELLKDIRRYVSQFNEGNLPHVDFFEENTYTDSKGELRPCYLVTKKGCEFIGNKLTGIKGTEFTAKYINRFHDMEEVITSAIKPLTDREMMRIQLDMIDNVADRVDKLENTMVIDYGQQQILKKRVSGRVTYWLGGNESNAYKEINKKVFSECNGDIQDYFNVNSRNNIPRIKFDAAIDYVTKWQPCTNTKMLIENCNAQMNIA